MFTVTLSYFYLPIIIKNFTTYSKFLDCLNSKIRYILSVSPFYVLIFLSNINVHKSQWVCNSEDAIGESAYRFFILNKIKQFVWVPSFTYDCLQDEFNNVEVF